MSHGFYNPYEWWGVTHFLLLQYRMSGGVYHLVASTISYEQWGVTFDHTFYNPYEQWGVSSPSFYNIV